MKGGRSPVLVWFRQDLRLADQAALLAAAGEGPVIPVYVLDDEGPGVWKTGGAQRWWLHHSLTSLDQDLQRLGSRLVFRKGRSAAEIARVAEETGATRVHCLHHNEPWWVAAEQEVAERLDLVRHEGITLAPTGSIVSGSGRPYRVFTPFWRALSERMPPPEPLPAPETLAAPDRWPKSDRLEDWLLLSTCPNWAEAFDDWWTPGEAGALERLDSFAERVAGYSGTRNLPSEEGTSRLSPHLHFGEVSPATVWHRLSKRRSGEFLRELAWRDFAQQSIAEHPDLGERSGRGSLDHLPWRSGSVAQGELEAWQQGRTGYPIVDAGMRELWAIGWMHNRVRMIAASFLTKHLLIDWREGARWFWDTLVDADYGNNSLNWQWVAGTGTDSAPFFRIMAPLLQSKKFDAAGYIRRWVPELRALPDDAIHDPHAAGCDVDYPHQIVGHREGRERALAAWKGLQEPDAD